MRHMEFSALLDAGSDYVKAAFGPWVAPGFFLQFSVGFDLEGLFDGAVRRFPLSELPGMPAWPTPDGHVPELLYGESCGVPLLVAVGHRHLFEGMGVDPCILPLSVAWRLGVRRFVFTDPVLSLMSGVKPGTWAVLTDFINGHHVSPVDGLLPLLSTPFPDMTHALSQRLNSELVNAFARVSVCPRLCIYESLPGSHFCTPAEASAARFAQADLVGHDLVMEIIMAHALGGEVSALALVAEQAPQEGGRGVRRESMLETCRYCSGDLVRGLRLALSDIVSSTGPQHIADLPEATAEDHLFRDFKRPKGTEPLLRKYLRRKDSES